MTTSSLFDLSGKLALVTGSGQGIGLALARGLAVHGARVVLNGRDERKLREAADGLVEQGLRVESSAFDVTDTRSVNVSIDRLEEHLGPIEILVNNAGIQHRLPLEQVPDDRWNDLLRTNLTSVFLVAKAVAKHMIGRGRGKIINVGSVQSELARPGIAPYTATKGAVRNLTRGMCADWARHGMQINCIAPGYFRTPLNEALFSNASFSEWLQNRTPAGRWGEVDELIGAAVFLAGPASSFVNGHTLYVDGGITVTI